MSGHGRCRRLLRRCRRHGPPERRLCGCAGRVGPLSRWAADRFRHCGEPDVPSAHAIAAGIGISPGRGTGASDNTPAGQPSDGTGGPCACCARAESVARPLSVICSDPSRQTSIGAPSAVAYAWQTRVKGSRWTTFSHAARLRVGRALVGKQIRVVETARFAKSHLSSVLQRGQESGSHLNRSWRV